MGKNEIPDSFNRAIQLVKEASDKWAKIDTDQLIKAVAKMRIDSKNINELFNKITSKPL